MYFYNGDQGLNNIGNPMTQSENTKSNINAETIIGLYGAGGFAREIMPLITEMYSDYIPQEQLHERLFFIETQPIKPEINGFTILSEEAFFSMPHKEKLFNIAIADTKARQIIAERCLQKGGKPFMISAKTSSNLTHNQIGDGTILCEGSIITANASVGKFFQANLFSYVAHDCVIGDYVTFAPRVNCNGNVHIGDHAYIGTSAILKQGSFEKPLVIGEGAIIGMGAVVTKDVPPNTVVVGNPAKPLQKRS